MIVIADLKDDVGNTIIAPIEMDGQGVVNATYVEANILTTTYGNARIREMLIWAATNDEVMYADKKEVTRSQ